MGLYVLVGAYVPGTEQVLSAEHYGDPGSSGTG